MGRGTLILGLGNVVLTDDGVGIHVARRARDLLREGEEIAVEEAEVGGFFLLELLEGYDRAVIIDAIHLPDREPGEILVLPLGSFEATLHLVSGHEIDLPTAVGLGRSLGIEMPQVIQVVAVQVADVRTLSEGCTEAVSRAIDPAAEEALDLARGQGKSRVRSQPPVPFR
jgi:hydrogenase maturation protease